MDEMRRLTALALATEIDLASQMRGPRNIAGTPLFVGAPAVPVGAELLEPDLWAGSWSMKNLSELEAFVRLRKQYIEVEAKFDRFRADIDQDLSQGAWGGGDGSYSKVWTEDARRIWAFLRSCPFGATLASVALPAIAPALDAFGSPRLFVPIVDGAREPDAIFSQDLLHALLKIVLVLRSFQSFAPVSGQTPPPAPGDLAYGVAAALGGRGRRGLLRPLSSWDIIEVGAGPGLHAAAFVAVLGARTYSIVDLPTQQHMQHKVLRRCLGSELVANTFAFVPVARRAVLADWVLPSYDLFLSTYALSELAVDVRMKYFYCFIVRSRRGFIIDNYQDLHGAGRSAPGDTGDFIGLDLVRRLQHMGLHVLISTYQQAVQFPLHPSRAVVITWASQGLEDEVGLSDPDNRGEW